MEATPLNGNYTIQLKSTEGKVVFSKTINGSLSELEFPTLSKGIYVLTIQSDQGDQFQEKLVVK